ncbi:hypothetical protein CFC21_026926 [Triticum aestivum]|uniref:DUF6598 domain-containing protein n=2 Tax=Triticum aestivum TaxID=4565 RepID=A0A9R1EN45_WHEAT|nr:uncharacterized protein LOC123047573 [Triticum aestivum]KAF7012767.1 hypothetical protein CFC21_026926 [Triticum aestivum]
MGSGSISSDMEMLMEEIISLRRERKDLMESLTPKISCWRDQISGAAISSFHKMDSQQQQQQVYLTDDFDILEDVEDLGQRMLSLAHSLSTSHAPISLYKADELVSTASKLERISLDFCNSTEAPMEEAAEEERYRMMEIRKTEGEGTAEELDEEMEIKKTKQTREKKMRNDDELSKLSLSNEFLQLSSSVLDRPYCYKNELAMLFTVEEEEEYERVMEAEREMERQRENCRRRRRKKRPPKKPLIVEVEHAADEQETKSQTEQLKEWMDDELEFFAGHRSIWERSSGSKAGRCGGFEDKTTLSPLQFTHCTPGILLPRAAVTERTLQIYSFKLVGLTEQLKWPLCVYGVVAARDTVDRNRNLLFSRSRIRGQLLSGHDSYLRLTGPSRAILVGDYVDFEVELKVRDGDNEHNDTQLMCVSKRYKEADGDGEQPLLFDSPFCTAESRFELIPTTVQLTVLSVRVVGGEFPFSSGGQVACIVSGRERVVLFDSTEKITREDQVVLDGYVPLSRNAVSVEFEKGVTVEVTAYADSGSISDRVHFPSKWCNISQDRCFICGSEVEITVAWSRVVRDKMEMLLEGYATQV